MREIAAQKKAIVVLQFRPTTFLESSWVAAVLGLWRCCGFQDPAAMYLTSL